MQEFDVKEAPNKLPQLVEDALNGEDIVIKKGEHAAVKLTALDNSGLPQFGSAKGLIEIREDFDAPLPDLEPYT